MSCKLKAFFRYLSFQRQALRFNIGGDTVSTGTMKFKLHTERPVGS